MRPIGLALTLALLTGTFIALDLSDTRTSSLQRTMFLASATSEGLNALSIMPSSVPGITISKADISDGVFAVGSSTGKEGLDEAREGSDSDDDAGDETDSPACNADKTNDFVLI